MKNLSRFALPLAALIGGYYLLWTFVSPPLLQTGQAWAWWLVLVAYTCSILVISIWFRGPKLKFAVLIAAFIGAYFLLADFVSPLLVQSGHAWAWWLILVVYTCSIPAISTWVRRSEIGRGAKRRKFEEAYWLTASVGAIFVGITLFLIDRNLQPWLEARGLGWLWLATAAAAFGSMMLLDARLKRKERQQKQEGGAGAPFHSK